MSSTHTYELHLPADLFQSWDWFVSRGYAPELTGTLISEGDDTAVFGFTEPEAWEFRDEWEGSEASGTCMADFSAVLIFLDSIV